MARQMFGGLIVFLLAAFSDAHATGPSFTLAPGSPTLSTIGAGPADILVPGAEPAPGALPPPVVGIPGAALGLLPGDVISAISYGTLPPSPGPGVRIYFSVDAASTGAVFAPPPANVSCEAAGGEARADVFVAQPLGPPLGHPNVLALDGNGTAGSPCGAPAAPGLGLVEPGADDVSGIALCPVTSVFTGTAFTAPVYFTLAPGSPTLTASGLSPRDIFVAGPGPAFQLPFLYAFGSSFGLVAGDVIDALDVDLGSSQIVVSLAPGSPSLTTCGFSAADLILSGATAGCAISLAGTAIGLATGDNVDAVSMAYDPDSDFLPEPCDNCPTVANFDQLDTDADGVGDACDPSPGEVVSVKKLFIKDDVGDPTKRKIQVIVKDVGVQLAESDDPMLNGASVQLFSDTDMQCLLLDPGSNWTSTPSKWKYLDPITKTLVQIADNKLKAKLRAPITYSLADDGMQGTVNAQIQFGTGTRYCMKCAGNIKDEATKFLGKNCVATTCDDRFSPCHQTECGTIVATFGSLGDGNGQFVTPHGLATDASNNLYVADDDFSAVGGAHNRIQKLDNDGNYLSQFGTYGSGPGQLFHPTSIAIDASGNAFVTDINDRVQKFDSTGAFVLEWGTFGTGDGEFWGVGGVAVDASGDVYVTDYINDRIQKFNNAGGFLTKWGSNGSGNGQFGGPFGVAVDPGGNVYVLDAFPRVQKFTNTGVFVTSWGTAGTGNGQFTNTRAIAVGPTGDVFVLDFDNAYQRTRIQRFDGAGNFISKWGRSAFDVDGWFWEPRGIAVDGNNNVFVSDRFRIQKFICP